MRYHAYFLSTTDPSISAAPRAVNIGIKKNLINIEFLKKIPLSNIQATTVEHVASDKAFSVAKAGAGLLLAGPVGLVGGALGGKKVTSILTITYLSDNGQTVDIKLEGKAIAVIHSKIETYRSLQQQASRQHEPHEPLPKKLFWSWILVAKLIKRLLNRKSK